MDREALDLRPVRTNMHFTLKENTLKRSDLEDFVACYFGNAGQAPTLGAPRGGTQHTGTKASTPHPGAAAIKERGLQSASMPARRNRRRRTKVRAPPRSHPA